jgi:hypothetical protein
MTDERPAGCEPVPARAVCRRADHPPAIGAADQFADCGHDAKRGTIAGPRPEHYLPTTSHTERDRVWRFCAGAIGVSVR